MQLYVHVPFCRKRCAYCAFYSIPLSGAENGEPVGQPPGGENFALRFADNICSEMAKRKEDIDASSLTSIFFGGGTPSLLSPAAIGQIIDAAARLFSFSDAMEITMEANPESLHHKDHFSGLRSAGVNRLSFGVQSFDNGVLRLLGRLHTAEQAEKAILMARESGFSNLGIDLIWGVPLLGADNTGLAKGRTARQQAMLTDWLQTLERAVEVNPDHISAYGLTMEAGTPLHDRLTGGELVMPEEETATRMFLEGSDFLESHGFRHYEISNFARSGKECRHNLGYWQGEDYLGLGPSATSTIGDLRWTTLMNVPVWDKQVAATGAAVRDIENLGPSKKLREKVMLSLRTRAGLDLFTLIQAIGHPLCPEQIHLVEELQSAGLASLSGSLLVLTKKGMLVSDEIIARFFAFSLKETETLDM